jgi:glycosyltransferase involved in cell wall biosynthesis
MPETNKTKLLVLNYEFPPLGGGASPVSYEIATRMAATGKFDIDVVTMGFRDIPDYEELSPNIRVHRVKSWRSKKEICYPWEQATYLIAGFFKARSLIKKNKYAACHTHFIIPTGALAFVLKKLYKLDYIITSHGSDIPGYNSDRFKLLHKILKVPTRIILNTAKQACSGSQYLADLGNKNLNPTKPYRVIREGFDETKFAPQKKEKMIFGSGRLLERKGFQNIIKAVSDKDIGYEVHIAGDGPMMDELKRLASTSKTKIVLHGWIDRNGQDFKNLLERAAIFCLPSAKENSSVSLFEGMSAGCAMITTNISGCPESVGNSGLLVRPNDYLDLKEKIDTLISDDKLIETLQNNARKRIVEVYDWNKTVSQYSELVLN